MFSTNLPFTRETVFTKSTDVIHRKNSDNTIILMKLSDEDEFFKIDGIAATIWLQLDGHTQIGKILDDLLNEYEVSSEQLHLDAETFIEKMLMLQMIS